MKKMMNWVLAAILICSATLFTACSNQDHPATPDLNLSEKILGKWEAAERDGEPITTNKKTIFTFVSATKAYVSASRNSHPEMNPSWMDKLEADVVIIGDKITLTFHPDEHKTSVHEFSITSINGSEFSAIERVTVRVDGNVILSSEQTVRFEKTTADYKADIIGTWQGRCTSEGSEFDDGQEHRWEYKADGTYVYYEKDGDNWVPSENTLNEYFVDGTLLCTRWIDNGVENREWWEITITDGVMKWKALRQKEDGTTYTATFEMTKVN